MKKSITAFVLILGSFFYYNTSYSQASKIREIAILDLTSRNHETTNGNLISAIHIAKTAGIPYFVTTSVNTSITYAMILATSDFTSSTFTSIEKSNLNNYVKGGGILVAPWMNDSYFYKTFGIRGYKSDNHRHTMKWSSGRKWFDDPLETTISLGSKNYSTVIWTCGYYLSGGNKVATFDDNTIGVTQESYGKGYAYALGFSLKSMILNNQLNYDFEAQRTYCDGFEPTSDMIMFFIKSVFVQHVKYTVWKHTAPDKNKSVFIFSHDIDCQKAMDTMGIISSYEQAHNIRATYFVTTHYIHDALDGDYYSANIQDIINVLNQSQEIGSHSVGHFPDFNDDAIFPLGTTGNTRSNYNPRFSSSLGATLNGTVIAEVEVSKNLLQTDVGATVKSFRSGYLSYPYKLVTALDALEYKYCSTESANDVLTHFPFYCMKEKSTSSIQTNILEIPLSTDTDPFTIANYKNLGKSIINIVKKVSANNAPYVLLTHPTEGYKILLVDYLVKNMPADICYMSIDQFGDYWNKRNNLTFKTTLPTDTSMLITIPDTLNPPDQSLSLLINNGQNIRSINVRTEGGLPVTYSKVNVAYTKDVYILFHSAPTPAPLFSENGTGTGSNLNTHNFPGITINNYPNPFTTYTTIYFVLDEQGDTKLELYNISGQKISTIVNERLAEGLHTFHVDANSLNGGNYIYRLTTNKYVVSRKITLLK